MRESLPSLRGRVALVTGASSGLGRHFGHLLAKQGARVALTARRTASLERVCQEIASQGGEAIAIGADVTSEASVIAAFDAAERAFGSVDTVIANAGVNHEGKATDIDIESFEAVMAVNVRGVFLSAREGARRMIADGAAEREHGRIVVIASIMGQIVKSGMAAYCASKAAALHMTKALAREWARKGVSINAVCPGYMPTELNADWFATPNGVRLINSWPRPRLMQDSDLDAIVAFLASDGARTVTGSLFTIDDGQSL